MNRLAEKSIRINVPKKKKKPIKVLAIVICVLAVMLIGTGVYIWANIAQIWDKPEVGAGGEVYETDPEASGLPDASFQGGTAPEIEKEPGATDILLIGVDNRENGKFSGRSDVLIYMRVDKNSGKLKLASFMRDTLVEIDGHGKNKLNAAYSFGGTDLTKKTFKDSFGLAPDYYIIVNFYGMEDIIEGLGGVDVNIEKNELEWLNININEINNEDSGKDAENINKAGEHHLNGRQAVAYMRIRHPGGDNGRIVRQQTVLSALFKKAKDVGMSEIPGLIDSMIKYVRTDIPLDKMLDLANTVKAMEGTELGRFMYPDDFANGGYKGMSIVQPKDFDTAIKNLHDFLEN